MTRKVEPYMASGDMLTDWLIDEPLIPNTEAEKHSVRFLVCGKARDAADAKTILQALGLAP